MSAPQREQVYGIATTNKNDVLMRQEFGKLVEVFGVGSLSDTVGLLSGQLPLEPVVVRIEDLAAKLNSYDVDFSDVRGQEFAKREAYPDRVAQSFPREPWFARRDASAYGIVLDGHGKIAWGRADIGDDPIIVVLTKNVSDAHLQGLRNDGVSYIFAGESELDLRLGLEVLNRELGIKRILLEGGGVTNGAFLRAGLVDEVSPAICPAIDGRQRCAERLRFG